MFCPNCGAADQMPASYCRRCGDWLFDKKSHRHAGKPEERLTTMAVFSAVSACFAIFSTVALYATYLGTPEAKWSIYVVAALCSVIAVHQSINFAFSLGLVLRRRRRRDDANQTATLVSASEAISLGANDTAPALASPSVTENTTELFPGERRGEDPLETSQPSPMNRRRRENE
jgi:ribosomal protein L40E